MSGVWGAGGRWSRWVSTQAVADVAGVGGALGAALGTVAGWLGAPAGEALGAAATAGGVGAASGGGLGLALWGLCRLVLQPSRRETAADHRLFDEFRAVSRALVRGQWRALLDGRARLDASFDGYTRIAPPRAFAGSLRQSADVVAALDAAATPGHGPRLLIVGRPGYGKTVALIDVAQHLADHHQGRFGVPVVFNLGGWGRHDDDLIRWMVRDLCASTGLMPGADDLVTRWVTAGWIAPMLDGLDEITDDDRRHRCVTAINAFIDKAPAWTAVVVASRPDEYTTITVRGADRLAVNAAIELRELRRDLVAERLEEMRAGGSGRLAELVATDPNHPAVDVLRVPLWLSLAGTVDHADAEKLMAACSGDEARAVLTDAYLDRAIDALAGRVRRPPTTCRRMLAAIAGFLAHPDAPDSTTFRFEDLTPSRLAEGRSSAAGLLSGLILGLTGGGLAFGQAGGPVVGLTAGLLFGLIGMMLLGLAGRGLFARVTGRAWDAKPTRAVIRWPGPREVLLPLIRGLALGVIGAIAGGLVLGLALELVVRLTGSAHGLHHGVEGMVHSGLATGMTVGLGALVDAFFANRVATGEKLDEGRTASRISMWFHFAFFAVGVGLLVGMVTGHVGGLVMGTVDGLTSGLVLGVMAGAHNGGSYLVLQRRVRRRANQQHLLARDAVTFVREAVDVRILRQASGGVQFRHRLLADRLAQEAPTPGLMDLRLTSSGSWGSRRGVGREGGALEAAA